MTINQVFEQAISAIKGQPMYAGRLYDREGVLAIIKDIQSKVVDVTGVTTDTNQLTRRDISALVEAL